MRSTLIALLLAVAGLVSVAAPNARAQFVTPYYYGSAYNPYAYYYPPVTSYYTPPYYWSARYYRTPYVGGWYYGAYSPYTNRYLYQYRTYPRHWVRW